MPLVSNAADDKQVKHAKQKVRTRRQQELSDLRVILSTAMGRRFIWSLLSRCGIYESCWDPSAKVHFNLGRRQVGLELMTDIATADENAILLMMSEAQKTDKQDQREQDALHQTKEGLNARSESSGAESTESGDAQ
jgi:hypothetical protein